VIRLPCAVMAGNEPADPRDLVWGGLIVWGLLVVDLPPLAQLIYLGWAAAALWTSRRDQSARQ
jgi:hypothetical protein